MATIRERRPGVWEVRGFTGRDERGRPTQVSRTVHGGKKDALRVAAERTVLPAATSGRRTVGELLDLWIEHNEPTWSPATRRDQRSRVSQVKADPIGRAFLARLTVPDVDRWHARLRKAGVGEGSLRNQHTVLRAALSQGLRWGWVQTNVASAARLGRRKQVPRGSLTADEVRRVLAAAATFDPAAGVALRLAAVTGARRSELAALRWDDIEGHRLTVDSSVAIIRHGSRGDPRAHPQRRSHQDCQPARGHARRHDDGRRRRPAGRAREIRALDAQRRGPSGQPRAGDGVVAARPEAGRAGRALEAARPETPVGDFGRRPRARPAYGGQPARPRQSGDDIAGVRPRHRGGDRGVAETLGATLDGAD